MLLRRAVMPLAFALTLACRREPLQHDSLPGLWVMHEQWESAPAVIVKDSGPQWAAQGMLIRFCPNGRFRMATGVFYRRPGSFALGPSDGLTIYDGWWRATDGGALVVDYKLVDAEIRWNGSDAFMKRTLTARVTHSGRAMTFPYVRPDTGGVFPLTFRDAAAIGEHVDARFVECSAATAQ